MINNVIFGFEGTKLTPDEVSFFKDTNPCGYILFKRNIDNPMQIKELTASLKKINNNENLVILIDQEGGRVRRLRPPYFREAKPAEEFTRIAARNFNLGLEAVTLNHYLLGRELIELGINVDCAPVVDLRFDWAHDIVGDRSFGSDPVKVSKLCKAAIKGLNFAGVHEIIKHIPGHGRAVCDSHEDLPKISTSLTELNSTDFKPFKALKHSTFAMTAHIVFETLDADLCITHSQKSINFIRTKLNFKGIIMSDDLSMKALKGQLSERARKASAAGCDILLHCNGKMDEMQAVAKEISEFKSMDKLTLGNKNLEIAKQNNPYNNVDNTELEKRLESYFQV